MNRTYKTAGIAVPLLMLASLYLPLSAEGNFKSLLSGNSGAPATILMILAAAAFLMIPVRVHANSETAAAFAGVFNLTAVGIMLYLTIGSRDVQIGSPGTVSFLLFGIAGLGISFLKIRSPREPDAERTEPLNAETGTRTEEDSESTRPTNSKPGLQHGMLTVLCGDLNGSVIPVGNMEKIMIGSDPEKCNLVFPARGVSREHCMITYNALSDTYLVMDQSTNGTYLIRDGKRRRLPKYYAIELRKGTLLYLVEEKNIFLLGA